MNTRIDTANVMMTQNIAVWFDGTLRPAKGHNGNCRWFYDGQVFYHTHDAWWLSKDKAWRFKI